MKIRANNLQTELIYQLHAIQYSLRAKSRSKLRKIIVNGSPKTGTTWMYKMITSIPGYKASGNYHGDIAAYQQLHPGAVVHSHDVWSPELQRILIEQKIYTICMVRDPRDQLISRVFHIKRDHNHKWNEAFKDMELDEAIRLCIEGRPGLPSTRQMIQLTQSWLGSLELVLVIRYEDLLADTPGVFQRVLNHCDIELPNLFIHSIVQRNSFQNLSSGWKFWNKPRRPGQEDARSHYRKGISGDWKNHMNAEHIAAFNQVAGDLLVELNYE